MAAGKEEFADKDLAASGKHPAPETASENLQTGSIRAEATDQGPSGGHDKDQEKDDIFVETGVHLRDKQAARDEALARRRRQMQRAASSASLARPDADRPRTHPHKLVRISSVSTDLGQSPKQYRFSRDGQKTFLHFAMPQNPGDRTVNFSRQASTNDLGALGYMTPASGGSYADSQTDLVYQRGSPGPQQFAFVQGYDPDFNHNYLGDGYGDLKGGADEADPPPTSTEEKKQVFGEYLVTTLSLIYGILVVVLGFVIYIGDVGTAVQGMASGYNLYLVGVSFLYLSFLFVDITVYRSKVIRREKLDKEIEEAEIEYVESARGNYELSVRLPPNMKRDLKELPLYYNFATGRHAGSLYLKVGAAVFCFGHLIHCVLLLAYHVSYFVTPIQQISECANVLTLLFDILYPIYSFFLLFFIFKYSHVMIQRYKCLAGFAIIHSIASSMCLWMWAIIRETMDYISSYVRSRYRESQNLTDTCTDLVSQMNLNEQDLVRNYCPGPPQMAIIRDNISPYLYPFTIEYSIIVAGILYVVWHNIGADDEHHGGAGGGGSKDSDAESTMTDSSKAPINSRVISSHLIISADCRSSHKGLLAGMLLLTAVVVNIIFVHVAYTSNIVQMGMIVANAVELTLLAFLVVAVVWTYFVYFRHLDVNHHPISALDDLLLIICMPGFFLYVATSLVPAILYGDGLKIAVMLATIVQVVLQTPLIIDGLRRCSNSQHLRRRKPGRELITFLVVVNVAMWIDETFDLKSYNLPDIRYDFYGKALWSILKHATIPLIVFYRFHASVCFVDIWQSAYARGA